MHKASLIFGVVSSEFSNGPALSPIEISCTPLSPAIHVLDLINL